MVLRLWTEHEYKIIVIIINIINILYKIVILLYLTQATNAQMPNQMRTGFLISQGLCLILSDESAASEQRIPSRTTYIFSFISFISYRRSYTRSYTATSTKITYRKL